MKIVFGPKQLTQLVNSANESGTFHRLLITIDGENVTASAVDEKLNVIQAKGADLTIAGCPYPPECLTVEKSSAENTGMALQKCLMALKELETKNNMM